LPYGNAPDKSANPVTLTLDMYRPAGDTQTSRPAIVLVHGGGFVAGNSHNGAMVKMANAFAQRGYVAVSINYRLFGQKGEKCGTEAQPSQTCITAALTAQHDAQAAIRWLRANATTFGVDPTRIAVGGGAAGAATALAVAVNSTDPGTSGNPGFSSKVGAAISISGALPGTAAIAYYDRSDSPILMFSGTADTVVPYAVAQQTAADLQKAGITVVFEGLPGAGHVPFATQGTLMIAQSVNFAYDHLNLARAAGQATAAPTASIAQPRGGRSYSVGQLIKTSFSCAEGNGGPGIESCRDSGGSNAPGGRLDTSRAGTHTYRVTALSRDGLQSATSITYAVKPAGPTLSKLTVSPRRFHAAKHGPTVTGSGGAKLSYRDTLSASTRLEVLRKLAGVLRGGRCVAPPRSGIGGAGHFKRCTRLRSVGSFRHSDRAGVVTLHFSGRLHGHALAAGPYLLRATASSGGHRSRSLSTSFRIL
jgi:acetyl esterase/lipase